LSREDSDGGTDQGSTAWTAEEIREWEEENDGVCPAFRVDHRPERQRVVTDEVDDAE